MERVVPDYMTPVGARVLADRIVAYWLDRGYAGIKMLFECSPLTEAWSVRSNMVNGFPPREVS